MATSEQIVSAYRETGSVWKAGAQLGVSGQLVWQRLKALGHQLPGSNWTEEEEQELRRLIDSNTLSQIAETLGRPYYGVALKASRLGIVTRYGNRVKRKLPRGSGLTKQVVRNLLEEMKAWGGSIRQFCRQRGISMDVFALAVQAHAPDEWRTIAWQRGLEEKVCPNCDATFYPVTKKQECCSRRCSHQRRDDLRYFGGRRREAIGMKEGVCQLCLQTKKSLSAHHVVGKENDENNDILIALCAGCHQLVGIAAYRNFLDTSDGWQRLVELVASRRAGGVEGVAGVEVYVDIEVRRLSAHEVAELFDGGDPCPR